MTTYRLEYGGDFVRVVADDGETQREIASCRGAGNVGLGRRWPQAVEDARLVVDALNAYLAATER